MAGVNYLGTPAKVIVVNQLIEFEAIRRGLAMHIDDIAIPFRPLSRSRRLRL